MRSPTIARCIQVLGILAASGGSASAQEPVRELVIARGAPTIDGELSEWPPDAASFRVDGPSQLSEGAKFWAGPDDASGRFLIASDSSHLYLAGQIRDDQILPGPKLANTVAGDWLEVWLQPVPEGGAAGDGTSLCLMPLCIDRPWFWIETGKAPVRQAGAQLGGVRVVGRRIDATSYQFEAAIPFHQVPTLRPGAARLVFDLVLHDRDEGGAEDAAVLSWTGSSPPAGNGRLCLPAPGVLVSAPRSQPWLSESLREDLPYLIVPLLTIAVLIVLLRVWRRVQRRARWVRPALLVAGVVLVGLGVWLPGRLAAWRGAAQRAGLERAQVELEQALGKLEQGTLASYRGGSRDRALIDLLSGKPIARQRYTSYRSLAQIAPEQFGPPTRDFDGLPIRPYWLPLAPGRSETFPFDPPLVGTHVHLVLGRPFTPSFSLVARARAAHVRVELDGGSTPRRQVEVDLDRPFGDGTLLGRDFWEVCVVPIPLDRELRALTVTADRAADLRIVGLSLEGASPGRIEPLLLGESSLDGVLTDLRGPYPQDAGLELAPGATAKVVMPRLDEPPQKLWLFYRASYPGLPTANPGTRVAEVSLHFAGGQPKRTLVLEHQVSMFYELAVHNTRDAPPEGSPASIALGWVDDNQEKHVNLAYPVLDLPTQALEAIEFRNVSGYRIRFRSVVFGNERAAAPQDPVDAPLVRDGQERRLLPEVLDRLRGTSVSVYRGGRLSETTLSAEQRTDAVALPRAVTGAERVATEEVLQDGSRRVVLYAPLSGDGWDGAVLAMTSIDPEWAAASLADHRLAFLLSLLGAPLVLVLLSELLAAATDLRFRLMAVMSVAALAPLGLLSLVLVRVLEDGHAADLQRTMLASVRSAVDQLEEQKQRLKGSCRQWLRDLAAVVEGRLAKTAEPQFAASAGAVGSELEKLLAGQLPPEWGGGFLSLEWQPAMGRIVGERFAAQAGDPRLANSETPARLEPGVFLQGGMLLLGVRAEEAGPCGTLSLTAGRPIDGNLLGALAPRQHVLLTDVRGYPVAASGGVADEQQALRDGTDPAAMQQREAVFAACLEQRSAVVQRLVSPAGNRLTGSEVLRDLQDTPRGLLVIEAPDQRATLDLAIGRIPVRAFFMLVAGCLVVMAVFLSYVVSGRISRPIERLEIGAQALSRGALDTRVEEADGGQVGRLTRTFNEMAGLLQARLQDLQALNRTMRELSAETDEQTTVDVLRRFCTSHTAADVVCVVLADPGARDPVVYPGGVPLPAASLPLARLMGAFSTTAAWAKASEAWLAALPGCASAVGLPIVFGGRTRGALLIGFARREPLAVDLELLGTVVAQAAVAFERSQLHRFAIHDPVTGAFAVDYFRRRIVDEVSLAQQRGRSLAMAAVLLGDGERRPRGLRRFALLLRERLPKDAVSCHAGAGQFHVALPGFERAAAERFIAELRMAWAEVVRQLPENEVEEQPLLGVVVQFPDEAPSAEFLLDALRARLLALHTPGASAMESDESLQRAGVTAISPAMRAVYSALRRVAPTDLPILLEGETGVGKEVLTNLVHRWSRRAGGPLIKVHCAALSETLLASELFGHEKGAFTGADRRKVGRFEQADGGTLFLDEVGDIPLDVQVKLLRVLQEGEVDRVGGTETVEVDVRVIAATNRDIAALVAEGRFRQDLYYRLQGLVVRVPPLRERKQEVAELVEHFRREIVASGQSKAKSLSTDAMDELYRQDWPGNVRQLRHTVFRAMILAAGDVVHARDVLAALSGSASVATAPPLGPAASGGGGGEAPAGDRVAAALAAGPGDGGTDATKAGDSAVEPTFVLPPAPEALGDVTFTRETLPPRLRSLLAFVEGRGACSTQDHMASAGVSHRTSLRDLQTLVRSGFLERIGSRRGAYYRPILRSDRFPAPDG